MKCILKIYQQNTILYSNMFLNSAVYITYSFIFSLVWHKKSRMYFFQILNWVEKQKHNDNAQECMLHV